MTHNFKHILFVLLATFALVSCSKGTKDESPIKKPSGEEASKILTFNNPIIRHNCPDPSIIDDRERSGYFYLYSTQNGISEEPGTVYLPVYKSKDMVSWTFVGNAFGEDRPQWVKDSRVWAPDINYINGQYVLYYALGKWGDSGKSACGVATSSSPEGPFHDQGMLVDMATQGVFNSIDAFYYDDNGKKYLFWGSFGTDDAGIHVVPLTDDGLNVKPGSKNQKVAGNKMEGTYILKNEGYYYMFGSMGSCCKGAESTYHLVVGRSKNILGPYVGPEGGSMIDDYYDKHNPKSVIMQNPSDLTFAGTGHNAEIIRDDAGQDWMIFHAYWKGNGYNGRCALIDRIYWNEEGWPHFKTGHPSLRGNGPVWKNKDE